MVLLEPHLGASVLTAPPGTIGGAPPLDPVRVWMELSPRAPYENRPWGRSFG
ncbi:hypothetical protein CU044_1374 [Streptomyces sp. L-9-10]|nr:hypothetical protein CU044_1374 [Streptomyces sp. L-9-10]